MIYEQRYAHQELKDYIRCYWKVENKTHEYQDYTIFPDGFFDLLICYHKNKLDGVYLTGLWDQKTNVVVSPETIIYGVQFRLLAAESIIRESISTILNDRKEMGDSFLALEEFDHRDNNCLFDYLNQSLLESIQKQKKIDPRKVSLLSTINQTKGNKTVAFYSQEVHWSSRQINRYFQSTFGLSLKAYCSIRKGAASYSQISKGELYPQQGYFDQPHFIKGIKKITGYTPKALQKNENDRFLQFSIIKKE